LALASYANLTAAIADELHRSDLTTPIADFILRGEKRIHREVRATEMEATYSGTIAAGVIAVPTDFLAWRAVYIDSNGAKILQPKDWEWVLANYPTRSADGIPKFIARNATNFEFGPWPDSTYAVKGTYYKRLTTVSSNWNALATANPDLYLYAALTQASAYIGDDPRIPLWESAYQMTKDAINAEAIGIDFGGGPLRVTPR
jgi:hypothetical protein